MISHIHRRGRLPHGQDDIEQAPLKTLLAQSGPKARNPVYDEAS
jgi:dolichol-phosphate mannosyltransferase